MARTVNIHEAKTTLSKLIEAVEAGEEITIARAGVACARLVPIAKPARRDMTPLGGNYYAPHEALFGPMSEEELADWEGEAEPILSGSARAPSP